MPKLSHRVENMPSSPIRRLVGNAIEAEKRGIHVHYLNIGQPDVESPQEFWSTVRNSNAKVLEYSHSSGIATLRSAYAKHSDSRGIPIDESQVLVTTGGSEATLFAMLACFDPGDVLIVVEPYYANYKGFAVQAGVELRAITTRIEDEFRLPPVSEFASSIGPRTKGILLCNPSNPTGGAYSKNRLLEIGELALEHDLFLIVDEVYRDFYYGDEQLTSVLNLPGMERNAVMLDSASKKFSLCGARVGFFVSKNKALIDATVKFGQARLSSPTLDQIGVEACLRETASTFFAKMRDEYRERRDTLRKELSKMPGVVCPQVDGAFYAIAKLPVDDAEEFCKWMLTDFQLDGQTVMMAPAEGFYLTPGLGRSEVRIAYVLESPKIVEAMACLAAGLRVYSGRKPVAGRV